MPRPVESLTWTVPEAARAVGVGRTLMWEMVKDGRVPSIRIGGRVVVSKKALAEWLDEQSRTAAS